MRKFYSAAKHCTSECKYCFAKWGDMYTEQPLFGEESIGDRSAVIYPCCDGDFFAQESSIDKIKEVSKSMEKLYISISTKNRVSSLLMQSITDLNDFLKEEDKGFVKFSVSLTTFSLIEDIEPCTLTYYERIDLLKMMSGLNIPLSVTLKPILPFVSLEEYFKIIDDCSEYVDCILTGGLYVNHNSDFYKQYIERKFDTVPRAVSWLPGTPVWNYCCQEDKIKAIEEYARFRNLSVFDSDVDVVKFFIEKDLQVKINGKKQEFTKNP